MHKYFGHKIKSKGTALLKLPIVPKTTKIVQIATTREDSELVRKEAKLLDKDVQAYIMYQMLLKQYMINLDKLNTDIDNCCSLFIGQYSPATE